MSTRQKLQEMLSIGFSKKTLLKLIPKLESFESEYPNIVFVKIVVDSEQQHAMSAGIRSVPTVMIYDGDKLVDRSSGINDDSYYKDILNSL